MSSMLGCVGSASINRMCESLIRRTKRLCEAMSSNLDSRCGRGFGRGSNGRDLQASLHLAPAPVPMIVADYRLVKRKGAPMEVMSGEFMRLCRGNLEEISLRSSRSRPSREAELPLSLGDRVDSGRAPKRRRGRRINSTAFAIRRPKPANREGGAPQHDRLSSCVHRRPRAGWGARLRSLSTR
jgi:hypothetical protein